MKNIPESAFFPETLLQKADHFGESAELFWRQQDVLDVIAILEKNKTVIYGLDFFKNEESEMHVLNYPDFSRKLAAIRTDIAERVRESCRWAREFVDTCEQDENHRFTITWDDT